MENEEDDRMVCKISVEDTEEDANLVPETLQENQDDGSVDESLVVKTSDNSVEQNEEDGSFVAKVSEISKEEDAKLPDIVGRRRALYIPDELLLLIFLNFGLKQIHRFRTTSVRLCRLLESLEYAKARLARSPPTIALFWADEVPKTYKIIGFVDDSTRNSCSHPNWFTVTEVEVPRCEQLYCSHDGVMLLCNRGTVEGRRNVVVNYERAEWPRDLFVCNPETLEYFKVAYPETSWRKPGIETDTFGFGESSCSQKYKLVRISHRLIKPANTLSPSTCQVYTLGSGSWRAIGTAGACFYDGKSKGMFLNGHMHWLVRGFGGPRISCFDLETESFSMFAPPPSHNNLLVGGLNLSVLNKHLYFCDNTRDDQIVFWMLDDYADKQSWIRKICISGKERERHGGLIWPMHIFEHGDINMALEVHHRLYTFCKESGCICRVQPKSRKEDKEEDEDLESEWWPGIVAVPHTPSLIRLSRIAAGENIRSFKNTILP